MLSTNISVSIIDNGAIIALDKPYGWSSFDAIRYVQRMIKQQLKLQKFKIGHAGTLDPLATGVLILCIGKATKQIPLLQENTKEYIATIYLGAQTPSCDLETIPCNQHPIDHLKEETIQAALHKFVGTIQQIPPVFSAKNIDGVRAYSLARQGQDIKMKPNTVQIHSIKVLSYDLPHITIEIVCSKGTYIRALARDIGEELHCGAYLEHLRRTACGTYSNPIDICSITFQ